MYFWYEVLFHRPQIFICKSLNKSGLFSRSVGTPDLRLFAEIFLSLNLLFANSFFRIPERADVVSNRISWVVTSVFPRRFFQRNQGVDGAKFCIRESEQIDNFRFVAGCFGSFDCNWNFWVRVEFQISPWAVWGGIKRILMLREQFIWPKRSKISQTEASLYNLFALLFPMFVF